MPGILGIISIAVVIFNIIKDRGKTIASDGQPAFISLVPVSEVRAVLVKYMAYDNEPEMTDTEFKKYGRECLNKVLEALTALHKVYSIDWDCENFAFKLYVLAEEMFPRCMCGVEFVFLKDGSRHARCHWIDENMKKWDVEPQGCVVTESIINNPNDMPNWNVT